MLLDDLSKKRLTRLLSYVVFYLAAFRLLESRNQRVFLLDTGLDRMIPFCPVFIVPYLLWFAYVAGALVYFGFVSCDREEYQALAKTLFTGCTVFLMVSFLFPNGQSLRPILSGGNLWERMVMLLYRADTPTNVFPSIHVFNSVACCAAIHRSDCLRYPVKAGAELLTALIVLSTLLLKQHTVLDVAGALALNAACDRWFYGSTELALYRGQRQTSSLRQTSN